MDTFLNNFGITLGIPLKPFWDPWRPQVASMEDKGSSQEDFGKRRERDPKTVSFWSLPSKAQVSFRLDGSTFFEISLGSLLDPVLASFWSHFGSQERQLSHQEILESPLEAAAIRLVELMAVRAMEINGNQARTKSSRGQSLSNRQVI